MQNMSNLLIHMSLEIGRMNMDCVSLYLYLVYCQHVFKRSLDFFFLSFRGFISYTLILLRN